jgi:hypothetical protein
VALLLSLVGPLTIQRYEKTQGVEESLSFKNWLVTNSYRAFATGNDGVFELSGNTVTFSYRNQNSDVYNFAKPTVQDSSSEQPPIAAIVSSREFSYLFFQPQILMVNEFGIINANSISLTLAGQKKNILIDKDSYEYQI